MDKTRLRKELLALLDKGLGGAELKRAIARLFDKFVVPEEFRADIQSDVQAQYDWMKKRGQMSDEERSAVTKELFRFQNQFARAKGRIQDDVNYIVSRGLRKGRDKADIRNELIDRLGVLNYHAETIVRTAKSGFAGIDDIHQATDDGNNLLTYIGPPGERDFCENHLGKTYTIAEIKKMDNGQGLPVLYYKGGYNCRHQWVKATAAEAERYNAGNGKAPVKDEELGEINTKEYKGTSQHWKLMDELQDKYLKPHFESNKQLWADEHSHSMKEYINSLNSSTRNSISGYTGNDYKLMNQVLRKQEIGAGEPDWVKEEMKRDIPRVMKNAKDILDNDIDYKLKNDIVLFRGESYSSFIPEAITSIKPGMVYKQDAILSVSTTPSQAMSFSSLADDANNSVVYLIKSKKGNSVGYGKDTERELLLRPEVKYKIEEVTDYVMHNVKSYKYKGKKSFTKKVIVMSVIDGD